MKSIYKILFFITFVCVLSLPSTESKAEGSSCCFLKDTSNNILACGYNTNLPKSVYDTFIPFTAIYNNITSCNIGLNILNSNLNNDGKTIGTIVKEWWRNNFGILITTPDASLGTMSNGTCVNSCVSVGVYDWKVSPDNVKEVTVGNSVEFDLSASLSGASALIVTGGNLIDNTFSKDLDIKCDNCKEGVTSLVSTSTKEGIDPKLDETVKYRFDSAAYAKLGIGTDPTYAFTINNGLWIGTYTFSIKLNNVDCKSKGNEHDCSSIQCLWGSKLASGGQCVSKTDSSVCANLTATECPNSSACALDKDGKCALATTVADQQKQAAQSAAVDKINKDGHPVPAGYDGPLPDCAFWGGCRDVNDLVDVGLRSIDYVFSIVAALAFVFFIYGGLTWILSFGNSEKVKKGQQIFVYAVIGLVIVFSAYILVGFLLDALNVSPAFRGV